MLKKFYYYLLFLCLLVGCRSQFGRPQMLSHITYHVIVPNHHQLVKKADDLVASAQQFLAESSLENLTTLQEAWNETSLAWMGCAPFEFDVIHDSLIHTRMDNRPAREKFIEDVIAGNDPITPAFLDTVGSSSQGLSAIEYLIFNESIETDPRRAQYVLASAQVFQQNAQKLYAIWSAEGDHYALQFINADFDGGNVQGSMNMLFNHMLEQLETITWDRLGKPLGKRTGGDIRPDLVEAPLSHSSLARIQATVTVTHNIYTGVGIGFDDYLTYLEADYNGQPLAQVIDQQFEKTSLALSAINAPLGEAIEQDAPTVENAYTELRTLITLLKVDAANHLGITLTFNDNDGD